jgi:hypothetical protein
MGDPGGAVVFAELNFKEQEKSVLDWLPRGFPASRCEIEAVIPTECKQVFKCT